MPVLSRLTLPLLAGAALSVLAACGPGTAPPADPAIEADSVEASVAVADHDPSGEGHDDDDHADHDGDHDHDEYHAGGTAHVHGMADLALSMDGTALTAELISPLANFGLSEAEGAFSQEVIESLPRLILLSGGNCVAETPVAEIDRSSGHTDGRINFAWTCQNPDALQSASFAGFATYQGFETVNAIFLTETAQKAAVLTPSSPQLSLK